MPRGSLFGGITEGIFGRLNELTDEQKKRDDDKRGQVLNVLTSLIDRVEPESQGVLLGHIGQVMGLKGKERGLWDRLTGRGMDATEQALGSKMNEVLGGVIGPEQAKSLRPKAFYPSRVEGTTFERQPGGFERIGLPELQYTPDMAAGKMVLRDPRQEKLDELEARYQAQFATQAELNRMNQQATLDRMSKLQDDRARDAKEMADYKAHIKDSAEVRELATQMQMQQENQGLTLPQLMGKAADYLDEVRGLKAGTMRERINLMKAQGQLAQTEAQGLQAGDVMTPGQARKESADARIQKDIDDLTQRYQTAFQQIAPLRNLYQSKLSRLQSIAQAEGLQFDEGSQTFAGGDAYMSAFAGRTHKALLDEFKATKAQLIKLEAELAGPHDTLMNTPAYAPYIEKLPSGEIRRKLGQPSAPRGGKIGGPQLKERPAPKPGVVPPAQRGAPASTSPAPFIDKAGTEISPLVKPGTGGTPPPIRMDLGPVNPSVQQPRPQLGPTPIPKRGRVGPEDTASTGTTTFEVDGPVMSVGQQFGGKGSPRYEVVEVLKDANGNIRRGRNGDPIYKLKRIE